MMQPLVHILTTGLLLLAQPVRGLDDGLGEVPEDVDRSSPLAAVQGFQTAAHHSDYEQAAYYLALDWIPRDKQKTEGPRLARRLRFVLDRKLFLELGAISKEPQGDPARPGYDQLGTIPLEKQNVPIRVSKYEVDGKPTWVFSTITVRSIDALYDAYGPPLAEVLPEVLFTRAVVGLELWQWLGLVLAFVAAVLGAWVLEQLVLLVLGRITRMTRVTWDDQLVQASRGPVRLPIWAFILSILTPPLLLPPVWAHGISVLNRSLLVISAAWFALRFLDLASGVVESRVAKVHENVANARAVRTQLAVLRRVLVIVVWILAAAALLMQFTVVRTVGVSLLASAGVAGVVLGLAAQKSIGALLAGIQLSITQPIRIGDQVVVEGENGTVEEITLTYVTVRVWDLRRLIVPVTQFLEKPFQNWSKGGVEMLGTVTLQVDWTTDIEALRKEVARILAAEAKDMWDGKTAKVQLVDSTEQTMQVRVLLGGFVDTLFDLRCLLRERLMAFLHRTPEWLPRQRTEPGGNAQAPSAPPPPKA
ncbi:MAG TPA: mechanosensitive ion channel domain-containing protein [Myxococcaceae bacterium]|nr:mechanosensitive ion channel domain-containing protein [Myxococcaceae bacterium]